MQTSASGVQQIKHFVPWHYLTLRGIKSPLLTLWYLRRKLIIGMCVSLRYAHAHSHIHWLVVTYAPYFLPSPPGWPQISVCCFIGLRFAILHMFFSLGALYRKNVHSAFQRWLCRAEQPHVKLCPVQSAEVKLTEMNIFYNEIHRQCGWHSCTAEQHRCSLYAVCSKCSRGLTMKWSQKEYLLC